MEEKKDQKQDEIEVTTVETTETNEIHVEEKQSVKSKEKVKAQTQEDVVDESSLSEDELYAKIQTEKLLKRKQRKKIFTLSSLCFAMALAICLIILAAVPISLKPRFIKNGFDDVKLYAGNSAPVVHQEGDEGYEKFLKYYSKAFSQTCLSAMFNGSLSSYNIADGERDRVKVSDKNVLTKIKELAGSGNYIVRLGFEEERALTKKNGGKYSSIYSNSLWDGELTFNEVYFVVNQEEGVKNTNIFVIAEYPDFGNSILTLTVKADTNIIYDAWNELT